MLPIHPGIPFDQPHSCFSNPVPVSLGYRVQRSGIQHGVAVRQRLAASLCLPVTKEANVKDNRQTKAAIAAEHTRIDAEFVRFLRDHFAAEKESASDRNHALPFEQPPDQVDADSGSGFNLDCPQTVEGLVAAEPELRDLLEAASRAGQEVRNESYFIRARVWKHGTKNCPPLKPWLSELVGLESRHRHDALGGSTAYTIMAQEVFRRIP